MQAQELVQQLAQVQARVQLLGWVSEQEPVPVLVKALSLVMELVQVQV